MPADTVGEMPALDEATSPKRAPTGGGARSSSRLSTNTMNSRRSNASRRSIKIDLNSFDENRQEPPYLTSPRSLEACKKQGVLPEELVYKPPSAFEPRDKVVPPNVVELRYQVMRRVACKAEGVRVWECGCARYA